MYKIVLSITYISLLFFFNKTWSQVSIADVNVSTCVDILYDTGGAGGTGYSENENHTLTICPDNPNDIITLNFTNFNLSTINTAGVGNPSNADSFTIYDGDNTGATSLGTYTGNQLQGLIVSCTSLNTTGCLTLVFQSNDQGNGVFAAGITCETPCQRPTVVMTSPTVNNNPQRICDGDIVSFDGSNSYAVPSFNIETYIWNWGDGNIDTLTTGITTHEFNNGDGEYSVNLFVIDDNGCINSNLETIKVQVGTYPNMSNISNDTLLCIGESVCVEAIPLPITWTGLPESGLGGATYLPDNVGSCFQNELAFTSFIPGQTLNNVTDLVDICVNMEHSFMGDLVATIICPNGQSVILHQQGGGGTFLGDPIDIDDPNLPGNCWQYCWSPTATNGTWVDNASFGPTPNVVIAPIEGQNSLAPGTYESLNPLSGLVGCPLNGSWTIEFCDLWGSDDGFICDWSLQFNPAIYPPLTTFTPVIGMGSDSSSWTGANPLATSFISSNSADMNEICITPTQIGSFEYIYTLTDNHGCTYDTSLVITVGNGATIDAGPDVTICPGDFQIDATATGGIEQAPSCVYTINMFDTWGDGWNGFAVNVSINGTAQGTHTLQTGSTGSSTFPVADGDNISLSTVSGVFDSEVSYEIVDCDGNVVYQNGVNYTGNAPQVGNNVFTTIGTNNIPPQYSYSWTPTAGVNSASEEDPLITTLTTQTYTVEVWETNHPNCISTDDITITVVNNGYAGMDTTVNYCQNDPQIDLFTVIPNNPDAGGAWYLSNGTTPASNLFNPATQVSTNFVYVVGTGGCSDTALISVNVAIPFVLNLSQDTIICENGTASLSVNPSGGLGAPYAETWNQNLLGNGFHVVSPTISTCYDVFVTDDFGCVSQTEQVCVFLNPPFLINVTHSDSVCEGSNAILNVVAQGGNGSYNYNWTENGIIFSITNTTTLNPTQTAQYCVEVTDGCETTPVSECVEIAVYEMPILSFASDVNNGCYPVDVTFSNMSNSPLIQDIVWNFGDGNTTNGLGPVTNTYLNPICYSVGMDVTTINGCSLSTDSVNMICLDDYPVADFIFNPNPTDLNQTTVQFEEQASEDAIIFDWNFSPESEIPNASIPNPSVTFPTIDPDNYDITLTVTNAAGCAHDTTYTLIINGVFSLYVPNSFTPNEDGINDTFFAKGDAVDPIGYEMLIFDRDGHIVFETTEFGDAWDGRAKNGVYCKLGVYVWKITAVDLYFGDVHTFTGHVTLIK